MTIHNNGAKAQRDREILARKYAELCAFFKIKPLNPGELAKLQNEQFYRLCEDTYGAQQTGRKHDYCEHLGVEPRRKPRAFKWFLHDLIKIYRATGARKVWLTLAAPFRYPAYLRRLDKAKDELRLDKERDEKLKADLQADRLHPQTLEAASKAILEATEDMAKSNRSEPDNYRDPINQKPEAVE